MKRKLLRGAGSNSTFKIVDKVKRTFFFDLYLDTILHPLDNNGAELLNYINFTYEVL